MSDTLHTPVVARKAIEAHNSASERNRDSIGVTPIRSIADTLKRREHSVRAARHIRADVAGFVSAARSRRRPLPKRQVTGNPARTISLRFQTLLDFAFGLAHPVTMSDESQILAANAAFYAAFAAGDFAALAALWADRDGISCIHPGWSAIVGRAAVIGSWRDILANPARPNIVCADPHAIVDGDHGRVLCIELVDGAALAAANHFSRVDGAWRMVHHQSSPIAQLATPDDDPDGHSLH